MTMNYPLYSLEFRKDHPHHTFSVPQPQLQISFQEQQESSHAVTPCITYPSRHSCHTATHTPADTPSPQYLLRPTCRRGQIGLPPTL
jgi:hypothetical protein